MPNEERKAAFGKEEGHKNTSMITADRGVEQGEKKGNVALVGGGRHIAYLKAILKGPLGKSGTASA